MQLFDQATCINQQKLILTSLPLLTAVPWLSLEESWLWKQLNRTVSFFRVWLHSQPQAAFRWTKSQYFSRCLQLEHHHLFPSTAACTFSELFGQEIQHFHFPGYKVLPSPELALPPSPALPLNSIDFCSCRSLVMTKLNGNSCGNLMDSMSQLQVCRAIITVHATFSMSDSTGAHKNLMQQARLGGQKVFQYRGRFQYNYLQDKNS